MKWTQWLAIFGLVLLGYLLWKKQGSSIPASTSAGSVTPLSSLGGALRSAISTILPNSGSGNKSPFSFGGGGGGGSGSKSKSSSTDNVDPNAQNAALANDAGTYPGITSGSDYAESSAATSGSTGGDFAGSATAYGGSATDFSGGTLFDSAGASGGFEPFDPGSAGLPGFEDFGDGGD